VNVANREEKTSEYKFLLGNREGKRPLGRPRRRLEDNTKMDLKEIGWEIVGWLHLVQDRYEWWLL
jgi:hypothetical protein